MAEGYKTYTPASVGVFLSPSHFLAGGADFGTADISGWRGRVMNIV